MKTLITHASYFRFSTSCPLAVLVALISSQYSSHAFRGANVPWTTYEAEDMTSTGTILGPGYVEVEGESSRRRCVRLNAPGQYVEFTALQAANTIVVRYSLPDSADGSGIDSTISLYKNGVLVQKLPVTSRYSWLYGNYPFSNSPGDGYPRNFYDEVRLKGLSIGQGDLIRIQKDSDDIASYYIIDLVDLERIGPPV